jgi:hypothetical protein
MKTDKILKKSRKMMESIERLMKMYPCRYRLSFEVERDEENRNGHFYDYCEMSSTESDFQKSFTIAHDGTITDRHAVSFVIRRGRMVPA